MPDTDYLGQLASNITKPIQAQPTYQSTGPAQPSGFMGTGGGIAMFADKFLEGASRGRAMAFAKSEQERSQNIGAISQAAKAIEASSAPDEVKQAQMGRINQLYAQMIVTDHSVDGGKKGKKGGGDQPEDEQHPANHILKAVRGIAEGMLGPGKQKSPVDPSEIKSTLHDVYASISDPKNTVAAQASQVDADLQGEWAKVVQANGGKAPTLEQIQQNPGLAQKLNRAIQLKTPGSQQIGEILKQNAPIAQAQASDLQSQVKEREAQAREMASTADLNEAKRKQITDTPPGAPKLSGALKTASDAHQILSNPDAPQYEKDAAKEVLARATVAQAKQVAQAKKAGAVIPPELSRLTTIAKGAPRAGSSQGAAVISRAANDPGLDMQAWDYLSGSAHLGTLVTGRGKEATAEGERIKNRAGQIMQELGLGPGDVMALRASLVSNKKALAQITTSGAMIQQFEGTLDRNAKTLQKLSADYARGDVQMYNRVLNAFKTRKGDPEALNLASQMHGVSREWAKIMAGSTSAVGVPISEAKETDELMSKAMGDGQLNSLIENVIRVDAKNRSAAINDQKNALLSNIRSTVQVQGVPPGGGTARPPGAPGSPANAAPPGANAQMAPPGAAAPPKAPQAGAKLTDAAIAQQFIRAAGGDKNKARELAKHAGWSF